jgi:hypothetical protein
MEPLRVRITLYLRLDDQEHGFATNTEIRATTRSESLKNLNILV